MKTNANVQGSKRDQSHGQEAPTDCGEEGCGECEVCRYLDHLEHASMVGVRPDRDPRLEAYLRQIEAAQ